MRVRMSSDSTIAAVIGAASSLVVITGSWIPSLWGDEAASIMSANRDWPSLLGMLGTVDVVHGLYYVALGQWIDLAGASSLYGSRRASPSGRRRPGSSCSCSAGPTAPPRSSRPAS
jgi:hypothetical protein